MKPALAGRSRPALGLPRLSLEHLWTLMAAVGLLLALRALPIRPHDFWWHMAIGREIVAMGHIPTVDTFSFTAQGTAYNYGAYWLMECALYLLYHWGGAALVLFCQRLAVAGAYFLIFLLCKQISRSASVAAACWLFAAAIGLPSVNVRPQIIAFPLTALYLWAIYTYRRRPNPYLLAVFPAGMALWVNGHGSFIMGFLLLAIWLGDAAWRCLQALRTEQAQAGRLWPPLCGLITCGLALLLNPSGLGILRFVTALAGNPVVQQGVPEWAPPSFGSVEGMLFLLGLVFSATVLAVSPRRPDAFQLLTFLGFGLLSLKTARATIWFGMAMAPVLADHLPLVLAAMRETGTGWTRPQAVQILPDPGGNASAGPIGGTDRRPRLALNYAVACVLLAGTVVSLPWFSGIALAGQSAQVISDETPMAATAFLLRARPPGRLFHDQAFGSYLIWAAQPDYPVFIDPRLDLFSSDIWNDYFAVMGVRAGWEQILARYGVGTLMLDPEQDPALLCAARESPQWKLIYEDARAVIFTAQP